MAGSHSTDEEEILKAILQPSGSEEKFKKRWIEFDCQKGVHYGKWSTYENGKRIRVQGGHIGRLDKVAGLGKYATRRVQEYPHNHACKYPERFAKDLEECGIDRIAVENWPSGSSPIGLSGSERPSDSQGDTVHNA